MTIRHYKVRPQKRTPPNPCVAELTAMLSCWASAGDYLSLEPTRCAEAAMILRECMRTAPKHHRPHRPTINYHLGRLGKLIKH